MIAKYVALGVTLALALYTTLPATQSVGEPELRVFLLVDASYASDADYGSEPARANFREIHRGMKWKSLPVSYVINPRNPFGLSEEFVTSAISAAAEEWDYHTSAELFDDKYSVDYNESVGRDGRNALVFGDYDREGVVAVAYVWGYFTAPPEDRYIIEFDVMFDIDYVWGNADENPNVMDLQNVATHEIGHGIGLDDLYGRNASEETMYGYTTYGETKKRTLHTGDIAGVQYLYGE